MSLVYAWRAVAAIVLVALALPASAWAQGTPPPATALVFSDGFESGDLSAWTGKAGIEAQQRERMSGNFAARAASNGEPSFVRKELGRGEQELYFRIRFKLLQLDQTSAVTLLRFRATTKAPILSLFVGAGGTLGYDNEVANTEVVDTRVVDDTAWHEVQVRVRIDGTAGTTDVWLDNQRRDALSRGEDLGTAKIGSLELGSRATGLDYDIALDDVVVDTSFVQPRQQTDPVIVSIQTFPARANVPFSLAGRTAWTDDQGIAYLSADELSGAHTNLTLPETNLDATTRVTLGRTFWDRNTQVRAALDISHPVTWSFVDLDGRPVDPQRITSITLKSSIGAVITFDTNQVRQPQWLHASRVVPTHLGLIQKDISYGLESVVIDGTNVVNRAQQRFFPTSQRSLQFHLMFYSLRVTSRDAFFGFATGSEIQLVYPDGRTQVVPLGARGEASIERLPRGEYRVTVVGSGLATPRPLALTKNQDLELALLSFLDLGVLLGSLFTLAVGVLLIGRPRLLLVLHPTVIINTVRGSRDRWNSRWPKAVSVISELSARRTRRLSGYTRFSLSIIGTLTVAVAIMLVLARIAAPGFWANGGRAWLTSSAVVVLICMSSGAILAHLATMLKRHVAGRSRPYATRPGRSLIYLFGFVVPLLVSPVVAVTIVKIGAPEYWATTGMLWFVPQVLGTFFRMAMGGIAYRLVRSASLVVRPIAQSTRGQSIDRQAYEHSIEILSGE